MNTRDACSSIGRCQRRRSRRRGSILVYSVIMLLALIGVASLAVDYALVQSSKTQLMAAVDAAARCATRKLATGSTVAQAQTAAIALAAKNSVGGAAVTLATTDVVEGSWNTDSSTFTPHAAAVNAFQVTGSLTAAKGNAVQLYLAPLLGRNNCDIHATATATYKAAGYGLVGLNYIKMGGNSSDSYWNTTGVTGGGYGSIASNGDITLSGSSSINGEAHPGIGKSVSSPGKVTGSTTPLTSPLVYANGSAGIYSNSAYNDNGQLPSAASAGLSSGVLNVNTTKSPVVPGGTYYVKDFTVAAGGSISFLGPTTIYVYGSVSLGGHAISSSTKAGDLKIVMVPDQSGNPPGSITIGGSSALYADIYAPQSELTMSGTGDLYGSIVALSIDMTGSSAIHYDVLADPNAGKVVMVQ